MNISNSKRSSTIRVKSLEHHQIIKQYLQEHEYEFHSFTPQHERKTLLELRGIHGTIEEKDVSEALLELLISKGITIGKDDISVKLSKAANEERQNNIFIIKASNELPINTILGIKFLLNQKVYWQRFHSKDVAQCKKCQQFLHVAHNCDRKYRCVKCDEDHQPGECSRIDRTQGNPTCVNCKGQHPANYKGCPVHKEMLKNKRLHRTQQQQRNQQLTQNLEFQINHVNGKSYAQMTKNDAYNVVQNLSPLLNTTKNSSIPKNNKNALNEFVNEIPQKLFGCNIVDLLKKVNNLNNQMKKTDNIQEQQSIYLNFLSNICVVH